MQKVAAYLLERRDGMDTPQARAEEAERIRAEIGMWLVKKGATTDAPNGTYDAEDGSHATYASESAEDGERSWSMVRLDELTADGRRFVASISVTAADNRVAVYASLEAGSDATQVRPVTVDPKCPRIIRTLLRLPGRWYHGACELRPLRRVVGFENGDAAVDEIVDPKRTIPIVVVSETRGVPALPNLDENLAHDLAGLANVVRLDYHAAWALTDRFDGALPCFDGAVRVLWPRLDQEDNRYRHPLWTADRLLSSGYDLGQVRERFRRQIRRIVMSASALSVVRPRAIDAIRSAASRRAFEEMKVRATSLADFEQLASSYAEDNDRLRKENQTLADRVEELAAEVGFLTARVENAELQLRYRAGAADGATASEGEEIAPEPAPQIVQKPPPKAGEIRFYKKRYSTPNHDVVASVGDCGCNRWESAHGADKAKKGIAKFEDGRSDWQSVKHCGACTGGGMWRVQW